MTLTIKNLKLYDNNDSVVFETFSTTNRDQYKIKDICFNRYVEQITNGFEYKNWIYYYNETDHYKIYRKSKDGSTNEKIIDEKNLAILTIANDYIIYENQNTGDLFLTSAEGIGKTKLADRRAFDNYIPDYCKNIIPCYKPLYIHNSDIYFNVIFPDGGSGNFYMFAKNNIEGDNLELLSQNGAIELKKKGDYLYFQETNGAGMLRIGIKRINLDSGEIEILVNKNQGRYSIIGEKIVFSSIEWEDLESKDLLYIMNLDGTEKELIFEDDTDNYYVEWIIK